LQNPFLDNEDDAQQVKQGGRNNGGRIGAALSEADPAIYHLERAIMSGQNWYVALLESVGLWKKAEDVHGGRVYRFLVDGEAFDWMLLAERLCDAVPHLIPEAERDALLYRGQPPVNLTAAKFKELIGAPKYHAYLNFFYGVTAEEALVLAVEDEVHKEKRAWGYAREPEATNEAYRRIYGQTFGIMLRHFRREKGQAEVKAIDLTGLKQFAYWRFKFRLKMCEKAKVASDSRKAVNWLTEHGVSSYVQRQDIPAFFDEPPVDPTSR
jgi:hypothetical protein